MNILLDSAQERYEESSSTMISTAPGRIIFPFEVSRGASAVNFGPSLIGGVSTVLKNIQYGESTQFETHYDVTAIGRTSDSSHALGGTLGFANDFRPVLGSQMAIIMLGIRNSTPKQPRLWKPVLKIFLIKNIKVIYTAIAELPIVKWQWVKGYGVQVETFICEFSLNARKIEAYPLLLSPGMADSVEGP